VTIEADCLGRGHVGNSLKGREEFAFKHSYAMALHTDDVHQHVHVILDARSEQGQRLDISKSKSPLKALRVSRWLLPIAKCGTR
jgi:hypothetical protein